MTDAAVLLSAAVVSALLVVLWACVAAAAWHFGRRRELGDEPVLPMTLIKPVKGLDDALEAGLESVVVADPERALQLIVAMESADDPAYPVAAGFAARHPDRDVLVLITGPCREGRMGKAHNMIEALPRAKRPRVIFSDGDTEATAALVRGTSAAFRAGYDAVFALPLHRRAPGFGGYLFQVAFNHGFSVAGALSWYIGKFRFCAGAWMAYTRAILERSGGLEPVADAIADDFTISVRARRAGAREMLLHEYVRLQETGTGLAQTLAHIAKWAAIIRWNMPAAFFCAPAFSLLGWAAALLALCETSGRRLVLGRALFAAALLSRPLAGLVQDYLARGEPLPWWGYPPLALSELGSAGFWLSGLRREIDWRGRRYRLLAGGRSKVIG